MQNSSSFPAWSVDLQASKKNWEKLSCLNEPFLYPIPATHLHPTSSVLNVQSSKTCHALSGSTLHNTQVRGHEIPLLWSFFLLAREAVTATSPQENFHMMRDSKSPELLPITINSQSTIIFHIIHDRSISRSHSLVSFHISLSAPETLRSGSTSFGWIIVGVGYSN